ncbi:MAG: cytochrome c biogenesis protein [Acidobacteriota bacterium]|nr:cytochrome c biogenesis protein [Acidobacteriota bacterium]
MRTKIIYALVLLGALGLVLNMYNIFLRLPDEANQGAIYRIIFFHVPAAIIAFTFFFVALIASVVFLMWKSFRADEIAVAATEVGLMFAIVNLVTGSIWGRNIWGIWWTWDYRITSMFVCCLLYAGYLIMRPAITDPSQRGTLSAVLSIFAFADVPIVWFSIRWWRTQHPGPVLETGGLPHDMMMALLYNFIALLLIGTALVLVRLRSEQVQREVESLRRLALVEA